MILLRDLEIAGGSVIGRRHRLAGRNNQDAFAWSHTPAALVAVVADGCSSGRHSEVGAALGARLLTQALRVWGSESLDSEPPERLLESAGSDVLAALRPLAESLGGALDAAVTDHFLFTLQGVVIAPSRSFVFLLGDGVHAVNGVVEHSEAADNAPAYLGYGLLGARPQFQVQATLPTCAVESLLVGTDGVADLVRSADEPLPGRAELVGPLSLLAQSDRLFANPQALTRRLTLIARDACDREGRRVPGLLPDDTTLVVVRRRP